MIIDGVIFNILCEVVKYLLEVLIEKRLLVIAFHNFLVTLVYVTFEPWDFLRNYSNRRKIFLFWKEKHGTTAMYRKT